MAISLVLFIMLFATSGCLTTGLLGYPSDELWLDEEDRTRSLMYDLAAALTRLEDAGLTRADNAEKQSVILVQLEHINDLINQFDSHKVASDVSEKHPFFLEKLPQFERSIANVRLAVLSEPPDFAAAEQLAHGCRECHQSR